LIGTGARRVRGGIGGLALLLTAVSVSGCGGGKLEPGPLQPPNPVNATGGGFTLPVGHAFTANTFYLHNYGNRPAVLDGVDLIGSTGGIELVGALVSFQDSRLDGSVNFPPRYGINMSPLRGFAIPPDRTLGTRSVAVFLGVRETRVGVEWFTAVGIRYHVGTRRYRYVVPYAVAVCTPVKRYASGKVPCVPPLYTPGNAGTFGPTQSLPPA
jgi:hypothetical protein